MGSSVLLSTSPAVNRRPCQKSRIIESDIAGRVQLAGLLPACVQPVCGPVGPNPVFEVAIRHNNCYFAVPFLRLPTLASRPLTHLAHAAHSVSARLLPRAMNSTSWPTTGLDAFTAPPYELVPFPVRYPIYYSPRPSLLSWVSDKDLSLLAPIVIYWGASLIFHLIDISELPYFEKYRIHEPEEVKKRNRVTIRTVIIAVVIQQIVQTGLGLYWLDEADSIREVFRDHRRDLQVYAEWISRAAFAILGPKNGNKVLRYCGAELTSWTYWWGIPNVQFVWARYVYLNCMICKAKLMNMRHVASYLTHGSIFGIDISIQTVFSTAISTQLIIDYTVPMLSAHSTIIRSRAFFLTHSALLWRTHVVSCRRAKPSSFSAFLPLKP